MTETLIKTTFGETLRKKRSKLHRTQQDIALHCETSTRYYQYLEKGSYSPSLTTIFKLAEAFDVAPEELINASWKAWKKDKKNR